MLPKTSLGTRALSPLAVSEDVSTRGLDDGESIDHTVFLAVLHVLPPALRENACFPVRVLVQQSGVDVERACRLRHADDGWQSTERVQLLANFVPVD